MARTFSDHFDRPDFASTEDAARQYDIDGLDSWVDDVAEGSTLGDILFGLKVLAFAAFAIFGGLALAALTSGR